MLTEELLEAMWRRYPHISPTLILKFEDNKSAITELGRFFYGCNDQLVQFENPGLIGCMINLTSSLQPSNTAIHVRFPCGIAFKDKTTVQLLSNLRSIEYLRIATENPLSALVTGKQKKQQATFKSVVDECLTSEIIEAMRKWELDVTTELDTTFKQLPGVRILVKHEDRTLITFLLDAWSGLIICDDEHLGAYENGAQVQQMLTHSIDVALVRRFKN